MAAGTSMSAPVTSGIVAMLLQINPELSPEDIKILFSKTAIKDSHTGVIPAGGSTSWGNGKVNAMGAVRELLFPSTGIRYPHSSSDGLLLYPNPGTGHFRLIRANGRIPAARIEITDIHGKMLKSSLMNGSELEFGMEEFPAGVYFLKYKSDSETLCIRFLKN
jgi:hypothetical protein